MPNISAEYNENVANGLVHLRNQYQQLKDDENTFACNVEKNAGNVVGCLMFLENIASASSLISWFSEKDVNGLKKSAYVAGMLRRAIYQREPLTGIYSPGTPLSDMLMPLISDHPRLNAWLVAFDGINVERVDKLDTWEFVTYQAKLALRGEWDRLAERSETWLANVPEKMKRFILDNRFHLALARGDVAEMERLLAAMVEPKEIKWRNEHEGYTGWFIVRQAVIYAKIAWRHGYEVQLDTPWIPKEWLPIKPLSDYEEPYSFIRWRSV